MKLISQTDIKILILVSGFFIANHLTKRESVVIIDPNRELVEKLMQKNEDLSIENITIRNNYNLSISNHEETRKEIEKAIDSNDLPKLDSINESLKRYTPRHR